MANTKMRVEIPQNSEDLLSLATSIYNKHANDPGSSPLNLIADYKWEEEGPKLALAKAKHEEAIMHKKKMEEAYRERDLIMANTPNIVRATRDLLAGINRENMKRLGDWGFSVQASAAAKVKPTDEK
ncbi:MAG: hypothetical protein Q8928_18035 [Bacteroidota bacterium]|nr:hypothetical protein [Bacteroidota bacterium]